MSTAVAGVDDHAASPTDSKNRPLKTVRTYDPDVLSQAWTLAAIAAAAIGGGLFSLLAWWVLHQTSLPAFNRSMVTRGLSTAGTTMVVIAVGVLVYWWLRDEHVGKETGQPVSRPPWRKVLTYLVMYLSPAAIVTTTIAIPLSATRLYLDGIQVDQAFRTQFLGRMAETMSNQDMNYVDMPTYYPIGWFWLGGRLADLLNMPGWQVYQPWAIMSLSIAGCILVPVWQRIVGSLPVATGIALVTTCATLVMSPDEPYAAIIAMGVPAITAILRTAMSGSWYSTIAIALFFGISASFYTLFTGVVSLSVAVLAALFSSLFTRWCVPLIHLAAIGLGSVAIALLSWGPFLWRALTGPEILESAANHFLPEEGTQIPIPFLAPSVIGVLCLFGLVYFLIRLTDLDIRVMALATIGFYLWALSSMVATLAGTSLLGFRVEILIVLMMATAGVLALAELRLIGVSRLYPQRISPAMSRRITAIAVVLMLGGGLFYAQDIPNRNETAIDHAYSDTDGFGERADRFVPDAGSEYAAVVETVNGHGYETTETVVLTDEKHLLSYYPFHGFNAFTSHYANPLGEFGARNMAIAEWAEKSWSDDKDPAKFRALLDDAQWRAPDVFVFPGADAENLDTGWKTHLAEDIYPNQPNVRYEPVYFNPRAFADPSLWHIDQVGPFVVVTAVK